MRAPTSCAVLAVLLLATACASSSDGRPGVGGGQGPAARVDTTVSPTTELPSTSPTPRATQPPSTSEVPGPVVVAVAGDVHAEGVSRAALTGGLAAITPVLSAADVSVVNLETAITSRGEAAEKEFAFRAPPSLLSALVDAGVDAVGLANNHGMDFGQKGLADTLQAADETGLRLIGAGVDEDAAYAPAVFDVRGRTVAVVDATQVLDTTYVTAWSARPDHPGLATAVGKEGVDRLVAAVQDASRQAMSVVVLLHWGVELDPCPTDKQQSLAGQLVAAGADAVVGSHSHVLGGGGWSGPEGTAYVDYGLGNFVFYARTPETRATGVLQLTLGGADGAVQEARWVPARITSGVPVPLTGAAADKAVADKDALRGCTNLAATRGPG